MELIEKAWDERKEKFGEKIKMKNNGLRMGFRKHWIRMNFKVREQVGRLGKNKKWVFESMEWKVGEHVWWMKIKIKNTGLRMGFRKHWIWMNFKVREQVGKFGKNKKWVFERM